MHYDNSISIGLYVFTTTATAKKIVTIRNQFSMKTIRIGFDPIVVFLAN